METDKFSKDGTCEISLETFLGGMETPNPAAVSGPASPLETFLGGMETRHAANP